MPVVKPNSALVIVGHGSTVNPDSSAPTYDHARAIRERGCFGEVHCVFWKEEPGLHQAYDLVERNDIYIVPNFISEGYFTQTVIPRELKVTAPITKIGQRIVKYCEPTGNHPRMTELLIRRAEEIAPGVPAPETSLIIVGHGTVLNDNSDAAVKMQVDRIRELTDYGEVMGAYMEETPFIADWGKLSSHPNVVVVPFFIADGLHSYEDIPVLMGMVTESTGAASRQEVFRRNPYSLQGRQLYYASAIGTEPLFADVILDQVAAFDRNHLDS